MASVAEQEPRPADGRSAADRDGSLSLFGVPKTDVGYMGYRMVTIAPTTDGFVPMEFVIQAMTDFVDLNRSYFFIELNLKKGTDSSTDLASGDNVYVTNNLAHNLIKQFNIRLNGTLISPQSDTYPYNAFFQVLLNHNRDEGDTLLKPQGWVNGLDHAAKLAVKDVKGASGATLNANLNPNQQKNLNALIHETQKYTEGKVTLFMKPYQEMFHTGKVLVPGVEIKMRLYFNDPDFYTWSVGGVNKVAKHTSDSTLKVRFHLCQLRLNSSVYNSLTSQRSVQRLFAAYPTTRSEIRTFNMPKDQTRWEENNLFQGRIPNRLIVGLLDNRAFNGQVDYYPFAFQPFDLREIKQILKGEEYPYETLELNQPELNNSLAGFFRWLRASGAWGDSVPSMLLPEEWGTKKKVAVDGTPKDEVADHNCTLYMWNNVGSGKANSPMLHPRLSGDLRLQFLLGTPAPDPITVVVYAEFEDILNIDPNGAVIYNIYDV